MKKNINKITGKKIHRKTAWIDKKGKEFKIEELNDSYLFNICKFMANGGGWSWFLTQKRKNQIFIAARSRFLTDPERVVQIIQFDDAADRALFLLDKIDY